MMRLFLPLFLFCATGLAQADEPLLRASTQLVFKEPVLARAGACAMYREGGSGWIFPEPVYWLKGTVIEAGIRSRRLERCPEAPRKPLEQYTREEFNRLAAASPCVSRDELVRDEPVALVRLRIDEWETPWGRRAANAGRLYQGHFLDRGLEKGLELELEADLLETCN